MFYVILYGKLENMKGYIYTMYKGADPANGWKMNDPIFKGIPTMGACRPDIRRSLEMGDYVFAISGRVINVKQHVVGSFEVAQKIDALSAYKRFPENRLQQSEEGIISGNIIVDENGLQIPFDKHTNYKKRLENYIVGVNPLFFEKEAEMKKAKDESIQVLNSIFGKEEDSIFKIIGRFGKKLDQAQVNGLLEWMNKIKELH